MTLVNIELSGGDMVWKSPCRNDQGIKTIMQKLAQDTLIPRKFGAIFVAVAQILLCISPAFADSFKCPPYIDDGQKLVTDQPGWTSTQRATRHYLLGASLQGPDDSDIFGDESITKTGKHVVIWNMKLFSGYNPYLSCEYHDTSIVMMKRLDRNYLECRIVADAVPHNQNDPILTCSR